MKDANGNTIEMLGNDRIVLRVPIDSTSKAYKHDGYDKVYPITDEAYESWKKPGYMKGTTFGTDTVIGEASVVIDLRELRALAYAAGRNKSKKSKLGPARAAFSGVRTWKADSNE